MQRMYLLVATLLATSPAIASSCDLNPLTIAQSAATGGNITVALGEADSADHPSAWQGPLQITVGHAASCTASEDVAIVEQPLMLGSGVLFVPTYSGSNKQLYALDTQTCKVIWQSSVYAGVTRFGHGELTLGGLHVHLSGECHPIVAHAVQHGA